MLYVILPDGAALGRDGFIAEVCHIKSWIKSKNHNPMANSSHANHGITIITV